MEVLSDRGEEVIEALLVEGLGHGRGGIEAWEVPAAELLAKPAIRIESIIWPIASYGYGIVAVGFINDSPASSSSSKERPWLKTPGTSLNLPTCQPSSSQ